jgi:hypothetical protein
MTWCSERRGVTTAAEQFIAENSSNDSADLIRACRVSRATQEIQSAGAKVRATIRWYRRRVLCRTHPIFSAVFPRLFIARTGPVVLGGGCRVSACE